MREADKLERMAAEQADMQQTIKPCGLACISTATHLNKRQALQSDIIAVCTNKRFRFTKHTPRGWARKQITPPITRAFMTRSPSACQQIGARRSADG